MVSLVGSPIPDHAAIVDALAATAATAGVIDVLSDTDRAAIELNVSGWDAAAVAEALAPVADGRIPASGVADYVTELALVDRMAGSFDTAAHDWPDDVAAMRQSLADQLRRDCRTPWVWEAWATALTREDDAARPTVADSALRWLDEIESAALGHPPDFGADAHHAGALHTYGYLCSNLRTKYGLKRTRWVGGGIAAAAGIPHELLQPLPPSGTLLTNATALAARLLGWEMPATVPQAVRVSPTARLAGRVTEIATDRETPGGRLPLEAPLEIRTSLFRRNDPPAIHAPNLLVYTLVHDGAERLVTLFDVDDPTVASLLSPPPESLGADVGLRLRYNASVDGIGTTLVGSRAVTTM